MVFIFDANISTFKRKTWIQRKNKSMKKRNKLYQCLRQGLPLNNNLYQIPTGLGMILRILLLERMLPF